MLVSDSAPETLSRFRIVLVEPSHPGNIGAAARAMKTMGIRDLRVVRPERFPDPEASARASGAQDLLDAARIHDAIGSAVSDCGYVLGCSARPRTLGWPMLSPRQACRIALTRAADERVAILFGRERSGLDNRELEECNALVQIPASAEYSSLNLAAAVQVIAYELRVQSISGVESNLALPAPAPAPRATAEERNSLYAHLESVLIRIGFLDPAKPRFVMRRIKRLINRSDLERSELNILRGILTAIEQTEHWRSPPAGRV